MGFIRHGGMEKVLLFFRPLKFCFPRNRNYEKEKSWVNVDAIDLNSQDPAIQQIDFFDFVPTCIKSYDCVVCMYGGTRRSGSEKFGKSEVVGSNEGGAGLGKGRFGLLFF